MPRATKIATCCYCGNRSAMVIDKDLHELVCGSCGAPLHHLKQMPMPAPVVHNHAAQKRVLKKSKPVRKKRKSFAKSLFGEALDLIEDIFD